MRRHPGRKMVVNSEGRPAVAQASTCADPAVLKALARAFRHQRLLNEGRYATIIEMAAGEKTERGYLGTVLRLTLLAPEIIAAALDGRQTPGLSLPRC